MAIADESRGGATFSAWPLQMSTLTCAAAYLSCQVWALGAGIPIALGTTMLWLALNGATRLYLHLRFRARLRLICLLDGVTIACAIAATLGIASYLAAMASFPLRDTELLAADRLLGIDWPAVMGALDRWPNVIALLRFAYMTHAVQAIGCVLVLALLCTPRDLDEFLLAFLLAGLITCSVSALVPALGPASHFPAQGFAHITLAGSTPADVMAALRDGSVRAIDLDRMAGVITFPSFHTVIALIIPYALRKVRWLFWPAALLDALMLAATITEGGHYVIDVLAGAAVAATAVAVARSLVRAASVLPREALGRAANLGSVCPGQGAVPARAQA